jgi:hypothetical protein
MSIEFVPAQTSVPNWLMTYCRQLADVHYERRLNRMYVHMIESFLAYEPWKAQPPFEWRLARIHRAGGPGGRVGTDPGWVPMNMVLPNDLMDRVKAVIETINVTYGASMKRNLSLRTFFYTAVCWWVMAVYPYSGPGLINSQ